MDSENTLQAYKNMKRKGGVQKQTNMQLPHKQSEEPITGSLDYLNEMAFGKYIPDESENNAGWSPENEVKKLKKGFTDEQLENSKLPEYLKESFRATPANDVSLAELAMQEIDQKMESRLGGFGEAKNILERIENKDKKKTIEKQLLKEDSYAQYQNTPTKTIVDYGLIKQIIEEVVERKLNENKSAFLYEGLNSSTPSLKVMKLSDNFMFLDSNNNVYECKLVYKGKNKATKKK